MTVGLADKPSAAPADHAEGQDGDEGWIYARYGAAEDRERPQARRAMRNLIRWLLVFVVLTLAGLIWGAAKLAGWI